MKRSLIAACLVLLAASPAAAAEGMIDAISPRSVEETADRLEAVLKEKGMTVFSRVRHSEAAAAAGIELRETELVLFGNPKIGSLLMQCAQSVAIDLPQKALIWKDGTGVVRVSYNDPRYLKGRHAIAGCEEVLSKVEKALAGITAAAVGE